MNWKLKALAYAVLSYVPYGIEIHYQLQRNVTKTIPISDIALHRALRQARRHVSGFRAYHGQDLSDSTWFEFGTGWDLAVQLCLYCFGVHRQVSVDVNRLLRQEVVNDVVLRIQKMNEYDLKRMPDKLIMGDLAGELESYYGIRYMAPMDARDSGLDPNCIDMITSTLTVQHIPRQDLVGILKECHRILKADGLLSIFANYQDHYAVADDRISPYNFLRYSDRMWRLYNSPLLFQNRLRHSDYISVFRECGFDILEVSSENDSGYDENILATMPIASRFQRYSVEELAITKGYFLLRPVQKIVSISRNDVTDSSAGNGNSRSDIGSGVQG